MLRKPYALAGCKLYKCVAVVTCLALTWVRGVTVVIVEAILEEERPYPKLVRSEADF